MADGFHIDATPMLSAFATEFQVIPYVKGHTGDDGIWVPASEGEPITVNEPIIPMGVMSSYSTMHRLGEAGQSNEYSDEWLSAGKYEMGTVVILDGVRLIVRNKDDYTNYSNLTVYYLDADSDDQEVTTNAGV